LSTLNEREATPTELATMLDASVGTVAYHVRTLHGLGLIELTGETRVRGAVAHHYRAVAEPVEGEPGRNGGAAFLPLDPELCSVSRIGVFDDEEAVAKHASLRLDEAGWHELSQACTLLLERADRIARASAERLAKSPDESERAAGVVLFMFEAKQENANHENGSAVS